MRSLTFVSNLIVAALVILPGSLAAPRASHPNLEVISAHPHHGSSTVQFASDVDGFDGPKIKNLNSTVFDLWYFDVISHDLQSSVVLVFFSATPEGLFPGLPDLDTAVWMLAEVTLPDGSTFETIIQGDQLTVTTTGNGGAGILTDSFDAANASWSSAPDMSKHVVTINAPELGIEGIVTLNSVCL